MIRVQQNDYDVPELAALSTSAMVDGIIRFSAYAAAVSAIVMAPNIVRALDKPLAQLDKSMDARRRHREVMKAVYYMKAHGYLAGDYEHGLQLTPKAKRRLQRMQTETITIDTPASWDGVWRIIIYDIPESKKLARQNLTRLLRRAGCFQLQKSAWITPFACRESVVTVAATYEIDQFITYFEAHYLDNAAPLVRRFAKKYPHVKFT